MQITLDELEELILTRDAYLQEAQASGRENMRLKEKAEADDLRMGQFVEQSMKMGQQLAAKDAEIARLTALHNERLKAVEAVKIVNDTVNQLIFNPLANLHQPAQEQADEHPAKKGWVKTKAVPMAWEWLPLESIVGDWRKAVLFWDDYEAQVIAAYDRYMQEGGQNG